MNKEKIIKMNWGTLNENFLILMGWILIYDFVVGISFCIRCHKCLPLTHLTFDNQRQDLDRVLCLPHLCLPQNSSFGAELCFIIQVLKRWPDPAPLTLMGVLLLISIGAGSEPIW